MRSQGQDDFSGDGDDSLEGGEVRGGIVLVGVEGLDVLDQIGASASVAVHAEGELYRLALHPWLEHFRIIGSLPEPRQIEGSLHEHPNRLNGYRLREAQHQVEADGRELEEQVLLVQPEFQKGPHQSLRLRPLGLDFFPHHRPVLPSRQHVKVEEGKGHPAMVIDRIQSIGVLQV